MFAGFFYLIDQIAIGVYVVLGAFILLNIVRFLNARSAYHSTSFELERDLESSQQMRSFSSTLMIIQLVIIVVGVQQVIVPFLRTESTLQSQADVALEQDDGVFSTSTPQPFSADDSIDIQPAPPLGGDDQQVILLTPTLTPTPVGTIVPGAPDGEGCTDDRAILQSPANGMRVFQPIAVVGTAYTENFSRAKLELRSPGSGEVYRVLEDVGQPVQQVESFSQFSPANRESGLYQFRLTVFDLNNTLVASCMVNIYIDEPPATLTPTGTVAPLPVSTQPPSDG